MTNRTENPIARAVAGARPYIDGVPDDFAFCPGDLQDKPIPARRWCVPDTIPDRAVTLLSGDGGTGKSILAMTLATACAVGMPFLGMEIAPRKVTYLYAEDDVEEAWRRQDAINRAFGVDFADLFGRLAWVLQAGEDTFLLRFDKNGRPAQTPLSKKLDAYVRGSGSQLLVIDTIADTFGGLEIDRQQVTRFVRHHQKLAADIDGAVLMIGHPSVAGMKDGRPASGSNAWVNAVRSALYLRKAEESEAPGGDAKRVRILERVKANFASTDVEIRVRYFDGVFMADHAPDEPPGPFNNIRVEVDFLAALRAALLKGRQLSPSRKVENYAPKALRQSPELRRHTPKMIEQAFDRLIANGELRVAILGTGKSVRKVVVPSEQPPLPDERDPNTGAKL
jgi:RecA-family ATPase